MDYPTAPTISPSEPTAQTRSQPLFGPDKHSESASSQIIHNLLTTSDSHTLFETLKSEIHWTKMHHLTGAVPRLVCCQGHISPTDGSHPVYRHPSDTVLALHAFTPSVQKIQVAAEKVVGHGLNHVLIQLYRNGNDYISEHSDKTLDVVAGSNIVNVSLGARRVMRLRTKRKDPLPESGEGEKRITYRVPMPHNSAIVMSLQTNAEYLHGINADKRPRCELVEEEMAFGGERISLTFRDIGTFLDQGEEKIWGQGAKQRRKEDAGTVINGDEEEGERLVRAFGKENASSVVAWGEIYGEGSDVLHLRP